MASRDTSTGASDPSGTSDGAAALGDDRAPDRVEPPLPQTPDGRAALPWTLVGLLLVVALAVAVTYLSDTVPELAEDTAWSGLAEGVEYPIYAILLGLLGNVVLSAFGLRERLAGAFRTEFFIKTGLVLLGASIDLGVIAGAAGPAIIQAILLVSAVFAFTWWLAGRLGVDQKLRALLASAVSICGVSAAIAAAGAVQAKKEQLAYSASLVIVFALPSIFLLPYLATVFGLPPAVAGAWIGGNIDTTAAVSAAGALAGEDALQIATIVKVTQNALMGLVAVALTAYFAFSVERVAGSARPRWADLWHRFPKFVLGFIAASVIATVYLGAVGDAGEDAIDTINALRNFFLTLAFLSIGLEFRPGPLREAGWRPIGVFGAATVFNLVVGLGLALLLFRGVTV